MTSTEKIKKFNEIINTLKEFKIDFSYNRIFKFHSKHSYRSLALIDHRDLH